MTRAPFKPFQLMHERVTVDKEESGAYAFTTLLNYGEFALKLTTLGLLATVDDDPSRHRRAQLSELIRADSLGDWTDALDQVLVGTTAQYLRPAAYPIQNQLTQRSKSGSWQFEAVQLLDQVRARVLDSDFSPRQNTQLRDWFKKLVEIRNKTKGHGAPLVPKLTSAFADLEKSINLVIENLDLFQLPWGRLYQNLSGKYRVNELSRNCEEFKELRKLSGFSYEGGVYLVLDPHIQPYPASEPPQRLAEILDKKLMRVDLFFAEDGFSDFFVANGGFNGREYELISLITGERDWKSAQGHHEYLGNLPESETSASKDLYPIGDCLTNLPTTVTVNLVNRTTLEDELKKVLLGDRHPLITLKGRGGIGKTTTALQILPKIAEQGDFELMLWFSARDLDLLSAGPKRVKKDVVDKQQIAERYAQLVTDQSKGTDHVSFMEKALGRDSDHKTLFIFDNFETMDRQEALYMWLNDHIRHPNKILITTRHREVTGDYAITVGGLDRPGSLKLIDNIVNATPEDLAISTKTRNDLYDLSDGHPYILKIVVPSVRGGARIGTFRNILIGGGDRDYLPALFERTFQTLTRASQRIFLTLASWNTEIPSIAIQCVLLQYTDPESWFSIDAALDQLDNYSFIERRYSDDDQEFIYMPLAARLYGKSKLPTSEFRSNVQRDAELLKKFDLAGQNNLPRAAIEKFIEELSIQISSGRRTLEDTRPMVEFLADSQSIAWPTLVDFALEHFSLDGPIKAQEYVRQYIAQEKNFSQSSATHLRDAWERLYRLCKDTKDTGGQLSALIGWVKEIEPNSDNWWRLANIIDKSNALYRDLKYQSNENVDQDTKKTQFTELFDVIEAWPEADHADDFSKLAWAALNMNNRLKAASYVIKGLEIDSTNSYCLNLAERFLEDAGIDKESKLVISKLIGVV